jgi:hypothetical protein
VTDHLDEAATKAVELAEELCGPNSDLTAQGAAQHLTYLAGLIRGGAVRPIKELSMAVPVSEEESKTTYQPWWSGERRGSSPDEPVRFYPSAGTHYDKVQADETDTDPLANRTSPTTDPRTAAANFRASAAKLLAPGADLSSDGNTWASGVRHGYLMAADALDEVADVVDAQERELVKEREVNRYNAHEWKALRAQRDELLAAARKFLAEQAPGAELALDELVTRFEQDR